MRRLFFLDEHRNKRTILIKIGGPQRAPTISNRENKRAVPAVSAFNQRKYGKAQSVVKKPKKAKLRLSLSFRPLANTTKPNINEATRFTKAEMG
jgi:hypothetical protein